MNHDGHNQHLLLPCCSRVRVRGLGFFLDFLYRPAFERLGLVCAFFLVFRIAAGAKSSENVLQKTPRYRGKRPGVSFFVFFHLQATRVANALRARHGGLFSTGIQVNPKPWAATDTWL